MAKKVTTSRGTTQSPKTTPQNLGNSSKRVQESTNGTTGTGPSNKTKTK